MKQLLFMIAMSLVGTVGALLVRPFYGVFVYYLFAVLRPQFLWEWSLPPGIAWSFYVAVAAMIAAFLQLFGVYSSRDDASGPRWSSAHTSVITFGVWVSITYFTAFDKNTAYFWFIENLKIFTMFVIGSFLICTQRDIWLLFRMTALTLGYIAYEINFSYLSTGKNYIWHNGFGGYDNNGAGLLMAMGVPLCLFCVEGTRTWFRWVYLAFVPVLVHAVFLTYSRGAMYALLGAGPLYLVRTRYRGRVSVGGILFAFTALPIMAGPSVRERFFSVKKYEIDATANTRFASWKAAWRITCDHPVFGVGVRNSNLFSYSYGADMEGRTIHNQYLQVAADCGFPGLGLYLGVLATAWLALRQVRSAATGREYPEATQVLAIASGIECTLAVFCIGAIFLSLETFELTYLLLLLGAQLAVCYDPNRPCGTARSAVASNTGSPGFEVWANKR